MSAEYGDDLYHRYLTRQELLPEEWTEVPGTSSYSPELTTEELRTLAAALDQLIRPYVRSIRDDAPAGSAAVHVSLRAFLNSDAQESQP